MSIRPELERFQRWLRADSEPKEVPPPIEMLTTVEHDTEQRATARTPALPTPRPPTSTPHSHQPWMPTHGRVDRLRRSERRG